MILFIEKIALVELIQILYKSFELGYLRLLFLINKTSKFNLKYYCSNNQLLD